MPSGWAAEEHVSHYRMGMHRNDKPSSLCTESKWKHSMPDCWKSTVLIIRHWSTSCWIFFFLTFLLWFSSSRIVYQVTDKPRVTSSASPCPVKPIHQIYYDFMSYMCVYLCKERETNSERKRACLHLDLWCCIGNQYGSFKSCRSSDWYLEWSAYGLGTRAVSLTVPIWVTLSALMPVHLLFVLKWISCK